MSHEILFSRWGFCLCSWRRGRRAVCFLFLAIEPFDAALTSGTVRFCGFAFAARRSAHPSGLSGCAAAGCAATIRGGRALYLPLNLLFQ